MAMHIEAVKTPHYIPTSQSTNPIPWADSQLAVFSHLINTAANADVQAVAGSGKTTTLMGLMELAAHLNPKVRIVYCAYNRRIVTEIEEKLQSGRFRFPNQYNVTVGTFHSLMLSAIRAVPTHRWIKIDEWAKHRVVLGECNAERPDAIPHAWAGSVKDLASAARFSGYRTVKTPGASPLMFSPEEWRDMIDRYDISTFMPEKTADAYAGLIDMTQQYLAAGLDLATRVKSPAPIDFDDMIWLPLVHDRMGRNIQQYDLVLVDEAQDLNYVRRLAVGRLCKPGGRVVVVGDPYQSIYAFTGAAYDSLDRIKADYSTITLPLHVSYRCPRAVVAVAKTWVSHITPADTAEEGEVIGPHVLGPEGIKAELSLEWALREYAKPGESAILCRNNQPLVRVFFELLRMQIPAVILGNDIAKQMAKVIDLAMTFNGRVFNSYSAGRYTVRQLAELLEKWEAGQVAAYREAGKLWKVAKVEDICGGIRILLRQMPLTATVQDVQARIKSMFTGEDGKQTDRVVLCSGHKSKGLEWPTVIWYGENRYQPSKFAKTEEDRQQEANLCYVMATRAQKRLVRVNATEGKE